ncbi:MAG: metal-dependent hydrolase [Peptococcaceae bacterium]
MAKIKWLGHACFQIISAQGKVIIIDPWLEGNPTAACGVNDITAADLVLVTHDHFDHIANAADIVKKTGATLVGMPETVGKLKGMGVPDDKIVFGGMGMNIGGTAVVDGIAITMTQAYHSSETANPAGYIIKLEDGCTIYHSGDTCIFSTMQLWGELYPIDVALLPVGGVFTMDLPQAARAVSLLKPKKVIPMHFKTFPILVQEAKEFVELVRQSAPAVEVILLNPGQECEV